MRYFIPPLALITGLLLAASALASQPRIALVIGNGNYENAPLANPVRDAALMADTLREVGFEVLEYNDLDRRDLTKAFIYLGDRLEEAGGNATTLVYYAGHGAQVNGENYLIPVGAQIEEEIDVEIEGVRASSLLGILRKANSTLNIVILDACRNNPFESSSRSAQTGLAKMDAPTGTLLAYSTAPGKVAEDGDGKNSTYTRALARAIKTPGAKVEEVFKTVRVNVVDRTQGRQVPWESSSLTGDFVFQEKLPEPEPEPVVTASLQPSSQVVEIEYWKSIANSTDPALFEAYVTEYPNGLFRSIAEQRIASLNTAIAEPEPDDGFEREKAVWNTVKDSANIGMLKGFVASFPDGVYATIANSMIADLEAKQQVASRTVEPVDDELVIWESVKDGTTEAEFQVYLDTYPEGRYAALARTKIAALNASYTPTVSPEQYPFDGTWRLTGEPVAFKRSFRFGVCRNTDRIDGSFVVERGSTKAVIVSTSNNQLRMDGGFDSSNKLVLDFTTANGSALSKGHFSETISQTTVAIPFKLKLRNSNQGGCDYELTMTRVK